MRCCVLGGAGFLGSHLVDALIHDNHEVIVVDNMYLGKMENLAQHKNLKIYTIDARYKESMESVLIENKMDMVFNLAVIPLPASFSSPTFVMQENVGICQTALELLREGVYKTLVHTSSSEVYGTAETEYISEEHPLKPTTVYAASKAACDLLALSYERTWNVDVRIARPFNAYGPRQNQASYAGLIPLTIKRIMEGNAPIICGDGSQTRDFTYAEDIVRGIVEVGNSPHCKGNVVNLGSGKEVSVSEIVARLQSEMEERGYRKKPILHKDNRPGDVRRHQANILKAMDYIKYWPTVTLGMGLKQTVDYFVQ